MTMEVEPKFYGPDHKVSDNEEMKLALAVIMRDLNDIQRKIESGGFDIDMYLSDPGSDIDGKIRPPYQFTKPVMITHVLATWDSTSNTASLKLGDRIMPLPATLGFISFDCAIQLMRDDDAFLQLQVGKAGHLELMGTSDYRKIDRS